MQKPHDDSKACLTAFVQDSTLTAVIEMSLKSWLVAGMIPGVNREPRKKIGPNPEVLLQLLYRWRDEAIKAGKEITRIAVAYETGRDGFWLARWLRDRGIDAHVIHATSVAVSREHRRAKTDRIDTAMLQRGFLGWLRGERGHCSMVTIPTVAEEDSKSPCRERESLVRVRTSTINRMKSILIQFGVRNFKPTLRNAPQKLADVRTPEGIPLPSNAVAALQRQMERFRILKEQIKAIEQTRLAWIPHTNKCIEAANQRKLLCNNTFSLIHGAPRCRQSVAEICSDFYPLKAALWWRRSTAGRSRQMPGRCCWARRIGRSG